MLPICLCVLGEDGDVERKERALFSPPRLPYLRPNYRCLFSPSSASIIALYFFAPLFFFLRLDCSCSRTSVYLNRNACLSEGVAGWELRFWLLSAPRPLRPQ